jgi:glutathione synthase/RimK-type ligase-like ATP-grasp enzyme
MTTVLKAGMSYRDGPAFGSEVSPDQGGKVDRPNGRLSPADVLVIDASMRQALVATRSLGRFGLRVGTAESPGLRHPRLRAPAFASRWSEWAAPLPSYYGNPDVYARSVLALAADHGAQVVIPSIDGSIEALRPWRSAFEQRGVVLALPAEPGLTVANDKERTLAAARELGIQGPRTVAISGPDDVRAALAEVGCPAVIKPTRSWTRQASTSARVIAKVVVDDAEAHRYVEELCQLGSSAIIQQWAGGQREAVNLFYAGGQVRAAIAQVAYRTAPVLGGVSVVRETISLSDELRAPAVALIEALGLDGYSEVEFRRDAAGRLLVMEINARLTAGIELAIRAGVDFPVMLWQWATGEPLPVQSDYRRGVRMRFLAGDLEWLWENIKCRGRPDSVPPARAALTFARDFLRRQAYDYVDRGDLKPAVLAFAHDMSEIGRRARVKYTSGTQSHGADPHP